MERFDSVSFSPENLEYNVLQADYVKKLAASKQTTPARIVQGWPLAQKPWIVPIPGTKRIKRVEENIGGADVMFTETELEEIRLKLDNILIIGPRYPKEQEAMTGL